MTLSSTVNRQEFAGNGVTTAFSPSFPFLAAADLVVIERDNTTQVEVTKTLTTHYTVSGGSGSTGTVTMLVAPATGKTLVIYRDPPRTQDLDLVDNDKLPAEEVEKRFDKTAMWAQRLYDLVSRCIGLSDGANSSFNGKLPNPLTALGILRVKADLSGFDFGTIQTFTFDQSSPLTTKGDLIGRDVSAAARVPVGADNQFLIADSTQALGLKWGAIPAGAVSRAMQAADIDRYGEISNMTLAPSVAANALTIALKTNASANPSATDPVTIAFRSATASSGVFLKRSVTGALSVVVSSGSTLGHKSAVNQYVYVYAIDNAGTVELAVCNRLLDEGSLQSTTAEGGAGAADSDGVLYSTTARANVAVRLLGRLKSNQAAAGTWATAISETSLAPLPAPHVRSEVSVTGGNGLASNAGNNKIRCFKTTVRNTGTAITYASSATLGDTFTINEDGLYTMHYADYNASVAVGTGISLNSTQLSTTIFSITNADRIAGLIGPVTNSQNCGATVYLRAGDVIRAHTDGNAGFPSGSGDDVVRFSIVKVAA